MSTAEAPSSNNDFVDFWNEVLVPKFVKYRHILVGGLTHHSAKIFPSLEVGEGERAVDVGCGFGDTALQIAKLVGPSGSVLGIDCCDAFLEFGRADAKSSGVTNVAFVEGDAQSYPFDPIYDFCFSRFGTQFFENPVAGLRNMRASLRPGGLACPRNSYSSIYRRRVRMRVPVVPARSPWPTRTWSPSSSRSRAMRTFGSSV